jgi:hypothetical protein
MNLVELQEQLKNYPEPQLKQLLQSGGSPDIPAFLAVTELQRRTDMRARFQAAASQPPGASVAEQLASGQGAPTTGSTIPPPQDNGASGISAMAPHLQAPQGYAAGGPVQKFAGGGSPMAAYSTGSSPMDEYDPRLIAGIKGIGRQALDRMSRSGKSLNDFIVGSGQTVKDGLRYATEPEMTKGGPARHHSSPPAPSAANDAERPKLPPAQAVAADGREGHNVPLGPIEKPTGSLSHAPAPEGGLKAAASVAASKGSDPIAELRASLEASKGRAEEAHSQSNWMAVAKAGLAMMSSKNPNFAGAVGEGGIAGLDAAQQGLEDYQKAMAGIDDNHIQMVSAAIAQQHYAASEANDATQNAMMAKHYAASDANDAARTVAEAESAKATLTAAEKRADLADRNATNSELLNERRFRAMAVAKTTEQMQGDEYKFMEPAQKAEAYRRKLQENMATIFGTGGSDAVASLGDSSN